MALFLSLLQAGGQYIQKMNKVKLLIIAHLFSFLIPSVSFLYVAVSIICYTLYYFVQKRDLHVYFIVFDVLVTALYFYGFYSIENFDCFGGYTLTGLDYALAFTLIFLRLRVYSDFFEMNLGKNNLILYALLFVYINAPQDFNTSSHYHDWLDEIEYVDLNEIQEVEKIASIPLEGRYLAELEYWQEEGRSFELMNIDIREDSLILHADSIHSDILISSIPFHQNLLHQNIELMHQGDTLTARVRKYDNYDYPEIQIDNLMGYEKENIIVLRYKQIDYNKAQP